MMMMMMMDDDDDDDDNNNNNNNNKFFIIYELAQQPHSQFQIQHRNISQIQKYNQQTKLHIRGNKNHTLE